MYIHNIPRTLQSVKIGDKLSNVKNAFLNYGVEHLAVTNKDKYLGILSIDRIDTYDESKNLSIADIELNVYAGVDDPIFKVWILIARHRLSSIPIINNQNEYLGSIRTLDLIKSYEEEYNFVKQGSTFVFAVTRINYSMSRMINIIEEHHIGIDHYFILQEENQENQEILEGVIRLNALFTEQLNNDFHRHNIEIKMVYSVDNFYEPFKDRYDELMHYLNV
ncbi:MAG: CBS domain-containing protein [Saprospiraceae bacterium]